MPRRVLALSFALALALGGAGAEGKRAPKLIVKPAKSIPASGYVSPGHAGMLGLRVWNGYRVPLRLRSIRQRGKVKPEGCYVSLVPRKGLRAILPARRWTRVLIPRALRMGRLAPFQRCSRRTFTIPVRATYSRRGSR
jgi:hypothetical protein